MISVRPLVREREESDPLERKRGQKAKDEPDFMSGMTGVARMTRPLMQTSLSVSRKIATDDQHSKSKIERNRKRARRRKNRADHSG
jgi:hypothetical protein